MAARWHPPSGVVDGSGRPGMAAARERQMTHGRLAKVKLCVAGRVVESMRCWKNDSKAPAMWYPSY